MGTDVKQVAWENAEIAAIFIRDQNKYSTLADAFLYFGSHLPKSCGEFSVRSGAPYVYTIGENKYSCDGLDFNVEDFTKILYETFYKHQL